MFRPDHQTSRELLGSDCGCEKATWDLTSRRPGLNAFRLLLNEMTQTEVGMMFCLATLDLKSPFNEKNPNYPPIPSSAIPIIRMPLYYTGSLPFHIDMTHYCTCSCDSAFSSNKHIHLVHLFFCSHAHMLNVCTTERKSFWNANNAHKSRILCYFKVYRSFGFNLCSKTIAFVTSLSAPRPLPPTLPLPPPPNFPLET